MFTVHHVATAYPNFVIAISLLCLEMVQLICSCVLVNLDWPLKTCTAYTQLNRMYICCY
jgi:hypothetical protein